METKWSTSIYSVWLQMKQLYLFRSTFNEAALFVPEHLGWSTSICSEAPSLVHLYLFRNTFNDSPLFIRCTLHGATLFVPIETKWNCCIRSTPIESQYYKQYIINSGFTSWTTWSTCSKTCGDGKKTRERQCVSGTCSLASPEDLTETLTCYEQDCKLCIFT